MDEKFISIGTETVYDLNAIDSKTKFLLAHSCVKERNFNECVEFLRQIKTTCYEQILRIYETEKHKPANKRKLITFVSDGFENYRNAFNKLFYRACKLVFGVPIACKKYSLKHNNNAIERYNGDIKDRIKTMRDLGCYEGAKDFLNLRRIIHNFVNPHMSLKGKTPAEEAEIHLKLGRMKLLNLIAYVVNMDDDK
ncbi:MAG: DDE-type integrase/transposase/recombinase [Nanoarchaeota archaeon]|nr:DDE-type integrase/transposase/recombinase [Nanoarchaeota archaeon]